MSRSLHPSFFVLAAIGLLICWRIWVRVRRLVGRQPIAPVWPWLSACLAPALLIGVFVVAIVRDARQPLAIVAGAAIGAALGWAGLRLTRFEKTPEGWFYTPSAPIGLILAAIFVGRLAYRAWALARAETGLGEVIAGFGESPLTLGVFALVAGHYAIYAAGLLHYRYLRGPTPEGTVDEPAGLDVRR